MKYKCLNNLSENNPDKLYLILFYTDWCEPCVETINIINDINYNNLEKYYIDLEELENEDLDFIIVTRFDLDIRVPISFNFSKFNFLFKEKEYWKDYNLTTDTLYAFPKHMLQDLTQNTITYLQVWRKRVVILHLVD